MCLGKWRYTTQLRVTVAVRQTMNIHWIGIFFWVGGRGERERHTGIWKLWMREGFLSVRQSGSLLPSPKLNHYTNWSIMAFVLYGVRICNFGWGTSGIKCTTCKCKKMFWTELYCTVLYCTVLYCTVLYCKCSKLTSINTGKINQYLYRPWGFQEFEDPRFHDSRHMKVVRLSPLHLCRLYPQEIFLAESTPGPQCGRKDDINQKSNPWPSGL